MGDLISRKSLLQQFLVDYKGEKIVDIDCDNFPLEISIRDVKDIIRNEPTAYDVDKVTEKLEKSKQDIAIILQTSDGTYSDFKYADGIELNKAIEIVKSGLNAGAED